MAKNTKAAWKRRINKSMSDFDKMKKEAASMVDFSDLPEGNYTCRVTKCEMGESQKGEEQIKIFGKIVGGDFKGAVLAAYMGLTGEKSGPITLKTLEKLGYEEIDDPASIVDIAEEINEEKPLIVMRKRGDFANVTKLADDDEDVEEEDDDEYDEADDVDEDDEDVEADDEDDEEEDDEEESEEADDDEDEDDEDDEEEDDEEEEAVELTIGSGVEWEEDDETLQGRIISISKNGKTANVQTVDGTTYKVKAEDLEPADVQDVPEKPKKRVSRKKPTAKKATKKTAGRKAKPAAKKTKKTTPKKTTKRTTKKKKRR